MEHISLVNEFSRILMLEDVGQEASLNLVASADECEALSLRMKVQVLSLSGKVVATIARDNVSHKIQGHFTTRVVQVCSITLDPFEDTVEGDFTVYFSPEENPKVAILDVEDQEFYAAPHVDVGEVVVQYVCLALSDFPLCPEHRVKKDIEKSTQQQDADPKKITPFLGLCTLLKDKK